MYGKIGNMYITYIPNLPTIVLLDDNIKALFNNVFSLKNI